MKRLSCFVLCILLAVGLSVPVLASQLPKIIDEAELLTDADEYTLSQIAQELTEEYGMDVVILTVMSTDGRDITAFADDYFDYNGYGIGSHHSGVLLVLAMDDREWAISTCGDAIDALTDYGQEQLMDTVVPYFSREDYRSGFAVYLRELDTYFTAYEAGKPIDRETSYFLLVLFSLVFGIAVAAITIAVLKSGMKTAVAQRGASSYVKEGSYKLLRQQDIFLYSRVTKVKREDNSSGSSSHRGSSGRSHGGSRGHF